MDWRNVPPLSSLRAYEAAVRTGSFSAAGRELNVTHAAISQHVRGLEARLETRLIDRDGMRLVPTKEGRKLAEELSEAFAQVVRAVGALQHDASERPLRVSVTPSFAEAWLMPRIGGFWAAHPDIRVEIAPSTEVVDLKRDGFDLAIRYGSGTWKNSESSPLMESQYVIVAAKGLHTPVTNGDLSRLSGVHWLLEHLWKEGITWLAENGIDLEKERVTLLGTTSLVLNAVRSRQGVTLVSSTTVERDVASGALEILFRNETSGGGYHIVSRPGTTSGAARKFIRWLKSEAGRDQPL